MQAIDKDVSLFEGTACRFIESPHLLQYPCPVTLLLLVGLALFLARILTSIMPATTVIRTLTLAPGANVQDPDSTAAKVVKECCDILASQNGLERQWFGSQLENPRMLQHFLGEFHPGTLYISQSQWT